MPKRLGSLKPSLTEGTSCGQRNPRSTSTAPNSGFEFAFHTEDGKISAVISVARPARADIRTIAKRNARHCLN